MQVRIYLCGFYIRMPKVFTYGFERLAAHKHIGGECMPELLRGGVIDASELKNALKALSGGSRRDESALLVPEDIFAVQSIICEWHNRAYRHLVEIVNFRTWVGAGCFVFGNFINDCILSNNITLFSKF